MFLKQMLEDIDYDELVYFYENDSNFSYTKSKYSMGEEDKENFEAIKNSNLEYLKNSLEEITLKNSNGLMPRVYLRDAEDELKFIRGIELDFLSMYPVDREYSRNIRKSYILTCIILLENSYYLINSGGRKRKDGFKEIPEFNFKEDKEELNL